MAACVERLIYESSSSKLAIFGDCLSVSIRSVDGPEGTWAGRTGWSDTI